MSKYFIRVSGPSSRGGGVYDGGNTLAEARKEAKYFLKHAPHADIAIVRSAPYHKTRNPHEERLLIVEDVPAFPPMAGQAGGASRDLRKSAKKKGYWAIVNRSGYQIVFFPTKQEATAAHKSGGYLDPREGPNRLVYCRGTLCSYNE